MFKLILSSLLVSCLVMPVMADSIIEQDWESGTWTVPLPANSWSGDPATVGGKWGAFSADVTYISDSIYHSGSKSLISTGGSGGPIGSRNNNTINTAYVMTDTFEAGFWISRMDSNSSTYACITGSDGSGNYYTYRNILKIYIDAAGLLKYTADNGSTYISTGYTVAEDTWTQIRWEVDRISPKISLFVKTDATEETKVVDNVSITGMTETIQFNYFYFSPQGTGASVALDDLYIREIVPEPITMIMLSFGGLLTFGKRIRR